MNPTSGSAQKTHCVETCESTPSHMAHSRAVKASALMGEMALRAIGREQVRATKRSMSISTISFQEQPVQCSMKAAISNQEVVMNRTLGLAMGCLVHAAYSEPNT